MIWKRCLSKLGFQIYQGNKIAKSRKYSCMSPTFFLTKYYWAKLLRFTFNCLFISHLMIHSSIQQFILALLIYLYTYWIIYLLISLFIHSCICWLKYFFADLVCILCICLFFSTYSYVYLLFFCEFFHSFFHPFFSFVCLFVFVFIFFLGEGVFF